MCININRMCTPWKHSSRNRGTVPLVHTLGTRLRSVISFTTWLLYLCKKAPPSTQQTDAGWAPEPVWMLKREKPLVHAGNQTLDCPAHSLVTILTELMWHYVRNTWHSKQLPCLFMINEPQQAICHKLCGPCSITARYLPLFRGVQCGLGNLTTAAFISAKK
jgi:hypothetical protein